MPTIQHKQTGQTCTFDAAGIEHFRRTVPDPQNWTDTETGQPLAEAEAGMEDSETEQDSRNADGANAD